MLELLQHGLRFAWIRWEREWTTKPVQNSLTSGLSGDENSLTIYFTTGLWAWQLVMVYICFHWPLCTTVNDDAFSVTTASEGSSIKDVHKNTVKNLPSSPCPLLSTLGLTPPLHGRPQTWLNTQWTEIHGHPVITRCPRVTAAGIGRTQCWLQAVSRCYLSNLSI